MPHVATEAPQHPGPRRQTRRAESTRESRRTRHSRGLDMGTPCRAGEERANQVQAGSHMVSPLRASLGVAVGATRLCGSSPRRRGETTRYASRSGPPCPFTHHVREAELLTPPRISTPVLPSHVEGRDVAAMPDRSPRHGHERSGGLNAETTWPAVRATRETPCQMPIRGRDWGSRGGVWPRWPVFPPAPWTNPHQGPERAHERCHG
jgi:hypothetical protein